jgi:alkanesulfonate monooxygenase SsuD/methylene tetrahydromethanopterin reductase-like flavin-dependent oxidoreductase (luciferase family)
MTGGNMTGLKFGLVLPYGSARVVAQLSHLAEEAGWDGCFLGDAIWCEGPMIDLAAAVMTTQRIRLDTTVIPVPIRRPWKLASESLALNHWFGAIAQPLEYVDEFLHQKRMDCSERVPVV